MRATLMYGAGDVRVENVPDPAITEPTDGTCVFCRAGFQTSCEGACRLPGHGRAGP